MWSGYNASGRPAWPNPTEMVQWSKGRRPAFGQWPSASLIVLLDVADTGLDLRHRYTHVQCCAQELARQRASFAIMASTNLTRAMQRSYGQIVSAGAGDAAKSPATHVVAITRAIASNRRSPARDNAGISWVGFTGANLSILPTDKCTPRLECQALPARFFATASGYILVTSEILRTCQS